MTSKVEEARRHPRSEGHPMTPTLLDIVRSLEPLMQCNCDLDNWQPEKSTGHSCVCRIHKEALFKWRNIRPESTP